MDAVTHTRVSDEGLNPTLDARALNLDQARLLARLDTPECDSMVERIRALRDRPVPFRPGAYIVEDDQVDELEADVWELVESNGREGQCERTVAGNLERIVRDLRPANGGVSLHAADIRRGLGPILDVLSVEALADPRRDWTALRQMIESRWPRRSLLCRSVEGEFGRAKTALLHELLGEVA